MFFIDVGVGGVGRALSPFCTLSDWILNPHNLGVCLDHEFKLGPFHAQNALTNQLGWGGDTFYETSITLITKPLKNITQQKKITDLTSPMSINVGILNKILAIWI